MALRFVELDDSDDYSELLATEWPVPPRRRFLKSQTLQTFKRDLLRYLHQEISGRSYLISGHRGAGKTSLAQRAVEDVLRQEMAELLQRNWNGTVAPQRPLFVKVHGPSLLEQPPKPAGSTHLATGTSTKLESANADKGSSK